MTCSNFNYQRLQHACPTEDGCIDGVCPDFEIKRHSTRPVFTVAVTDCGGPLDLTDCVCEVSMWAKAKLKTAITNSATSLQFADNIGYQQCKEGDIIVVDQVRDPEQMRIVGFDEANKTVLVQRAVHSTLAVAHKRGTGLRIFRIRKAPGEITLATEDIEQIDGTVERDVLVSVTLSYSWDAADTCVPGCFYFEFKILKLIVSDLDDPTLYGSADAESSGFVSYRCALPENVEWIRRFPATEGFLVKIAPSATAENVE